MKLCWLDVRALDDPIRAAVLEEALHQRITGIVSDDPEHFATLPPTVRKVLFCGGPTLPESFDGIDVVIVDPRQHGETPASLAVRHPDQEFGRFVQVSDAESLDVACRSAATEPWTMLHFTDPTKIPLEIVIAAADAAEGRLITMVDDIPEAEVVFGCLEKGSDGVLMAPRKPGDATDLQRAAEDTSPELALVELRVTGITHVGMGERACVDTCTYLRQNEGILVGSHSKGMILCVSETHPLPYMPTRPFRVNAGAIHSYTLSADGRTNYLSELRSGGKVMAVDTKGQTRMVTVGRVKIESRPLLSIDAVAPDGRTVNLMLQDDWHVRVLGPDAAVLNSTHLKPGDVLLGYQPAEERHVGYPIDEFCLEQ
ncbi:MAG TPA: 3-dehydroquinate synthase II [Pseudonocardiaceae bacterium]|jgi:3-amino-4-hydroxybenzoic acid synthase|nr:3-dehydroquinate synthase II [Pseudonocardiaceae bacterium]